MYRVEFSPESNRDLEETYEFIALEASPAIAFLYTEAIRSFCLELSYSPHRGTERINLRRGIRVVGFRRRVAIHFRVSEENQLVSIARILYAGRTDRKSRG